jgi:hypothetical protein
MQNLSGKSGRLEDRGDRKITIRSLRVRGREETVSGGADFGISLAESECSQHQKLNTRFA